MKWKMGSESFTGKEEMSARIDRSLSTTNFALKNRFITLRGGVVIIVITSEAPVFPLRPAQRTAETPTLPENRRLGSASGASLRRSDAEVQCAAAVAEGLAGGKGATRAACVYEATVGLVASCSVDPGPATYAHTPPCDEESNGCCDLCADPCLNERGWDVGRRDPKGMGPRDTPPLPKPCRATVSSHTLTSEAG
ncbi:unnamed protein product [Gadus morhua 'NCC']